MGFIDRFLNAIKLNDDFDDDDFLDDEEDLDDYDDDSYEKPKTRKRFFSKFGSADDEDDFDDDEDDETDEEPVTARRSSRTRTAPAKKESRKSTPSRSASSSDYEPASARRKTRSTTSASSDSGYSYGGASSSSSYAGTGRKQKVTPIRKKAAPSASSMEVSVIRPSSMEDTREIADTLMNGCTVILNLEGLDVDIAQRVIDFSCGVCYSLEGRLQKVASYIFILTPADVDISGDFQSILTGAFDLSAMQTNY